MEKKVVMKGFSNKTNKAFTREFFYIKKCKKIADSLIKELVQILKLLLKTSLPITDMVDDLLRRKTSY